MSKPTDAIIQALMETQPIRGGTTSKIDTYFGDRPDVLDALRAAKTERKLSFRQISEVISNLDPEHSVGETAVRKWFYSQGIR